ncbi:N-acetylglucosamine kinase-like BadF-type ATPase [Thermosporothrix hazakensis]|uniref:N-acetylglucosamine kinase-like BadF-type ATPase n=2 Tax=Thermosporothrix TaxID=768650 RepID=A0A326UBK5_THEHA|nr:BadF/BadG/BcrA/BcrD ATPase family protein [Thermosporothrix hazakensis]PZW25391.1 N-acetylglucosamine kinase-like BadF-type ATPase [Thermosporothrix hazakensis]BBH90725.1 N-acetylmuramic acid/N-acetylglucosamine kinase [Thermosporothrix sp. COM3]GCE48775.1 N-acetylmuramic acid/N-acetylglucosamine kinase [Thermosporothrix hazakensis]
MRIPILAVDGGATKCLVVCAEQDGSWRGEGHAGPGNYQSVGAEEAEQNVTLAIHEALKGAGIQEPEVDIALFGMAGLDTTHDRLIIEDLIKNALRRNGVQAQEIFLENDGFAALLGATAGHAGVLAIAGTGSIVFGLNTEGKSARAGGWGHRVGDEGGGYWIGKEAIRSVLRAFDGRGPTTHLSALVLETLHFRHPTDLIDWVYSDSYTIAKIAGLSRVVGEAARTGDEVAKTILRRAADELFMAVRAVVDTLQMRRERFPVVLQGGILQNEALVRSTLTAQIMAYAPSAFIDAAKLQPVEGIIAKGKALLQEKGSR